MRKRRVKVDLSALAGADLPSGADSIGLNLFADTNLTAVKQRFERRGPDRFTWVGKISDDPLSMVVLVAGDGQMQGTVFARGKHFSIRGADAASQEVVEVDQSAFPPEACDHIPAGDQAAITPASPSSQDTFSDTAALIDLLVVYTPAARIAQGGTAAIQTLAQLAVDATNTSYANSGVTTRLRLAHTEEVAYTESGDWDIDLTRLASASDGYLDSVHALRDAYGADVVALLVKRDPLICGLADAIMATASTAFCLVGYDCAVTNYSFGHEIGHIQGARHDLYVDSLGTFNHGHVDLASRQRTVMAYNNKCAATPPYTPCTRVPYFSNPGVLYPSTATPAGSLTWEDNTLQLNNSAFTVANFRQNPTLTVQSTYPAVGVTITVSPADNNALGNGSTVFLRSYAPGIAVTLTAPTTADGNPFASWGGCDSVGGTSGEICSVTMNNSRTVTASYVRNLTTRPVASVLWSRSDTGQGVVWEIDPGTAVLQNPVWLASQAGVGAPWLATSYTRLNASTGYVLWSRSDIGAAALWKINPTTGAVVSAADLFSASGIGGPWRATSYVHVSDTEAYVLWTRSDTGVAALWKINPGAVGGTIPVLSSAYLSSAAGIGGPWQATSYARVSATEAYVLWTRSDIGAAALWKINPGAVSGTIPVLGAAYLYSAAGVGGPWQATGYEHVDASTGYVLWTRGDTGQGAVWKITPGSLAGTIPFDSQFTPYPADLSGYPASLVGGPWQATSYVPTNTAPTLDALSPLTINEDAGQQTMNLSGITTGGESQTLTVTAVSSNTALIPDPTVTYTSPNTTGSLTFTPVANVVGVATVTVTVNDGQSGYSTIVRTFTVTVAAVNDPPTDISLSSNIVDGNLPAGTAVGTLGTTDPDTGDTFTYTLVSGTGSTGNASFQISGSELQTKLPLDYAVTNPFSIRVRSTDLGGLFTEKIFTVVPPAYVLWTRSDTGQAALWRLDPATGALRNTVWISSSGVGASWQATSYAHVDGTTGYVLWTRSDTGQAALWKVDPVTGSATGSSYLYSTSGVGGPWRATGYEHVDAATGYVLWTRSDTGQAALWRIDPSGVGSLPVIVPAAMAYLYSSSGVGGPWQATGYEHVDAATGYVLWTRSDTGQAALWRIDPAGLGSLPVIAPAGSAYLYSSTGVGGPWQAASYAHVNAATGYVLWTRSDTGQAVLWTIDPGGVGSLPAIMPAGSLYLYSSSGVGGPWQAASYFHRRQ